QARHTPLLFPARGCGSSHIRRPSRRAVDVRLALDIWCEYYSREMASGRLRRQTPRRYRMVQRAAAVDKTRDQIIRAAVAVQAKHGIAETSWASIGGAAQVSTATVDRHFPSLDSMVPACPRPTF